MRAVLVRRGGDCHRDPRLRPPRDRRRSDRRSQAMSAAANRPRIGFLGIGIMGEAMVRRLLDLGFPVTVWNLEPARLDTVVPHGAVAAESPAAVAAASDIVMLCVLHMAAVERC